MKLDLKSVNVKVLFKRQKYELLRNVAKKKELKVRRCADILAGYSNSCVYPYGEPHVDQDPKRDVEHVERSRKVRDSH